MPRKRYKPEEIVAKLRQVGGCSGLAGSGYGGCSPSDRCGRGDLLSLAPRIWRAEDRTGTFYAGTLTRGAVRSETALRSRLSAC
jgi:hypothetical protein